MIMKVKIQVQKYGRSGKDSSDVFSTSNLLINLYPIE